MHLDENVGCVDRNIAFMQKDNSNAIHVDFVYCNEITASGTDDSTGPYRDTESTITVSEIIYHVDETDYAIQVNPEIESIIKNIIYTIQK